MGNLSIEPDQRRQFIDGVFRAGRIDDTQTLAVMQRIHHDTGMLLDPHSAVGVGVAQQMRNQLGPMVVTLATAHPAKFPDAVQRATGVHPPLPPHLADLFDRDERFTVLPNDLAIIERFVEATSSV